MEEDVLAGAIDMHVHAAPDVHERQFTEWELTEIYARAGMAGYVSKCHAGDTAARAAIVNSEGEGAKAYGGIVLNRPVGGFNPAAVEASAALGGRVVWLPTIDPIPMMDEAGHLLTETLKVLECVRDRNMVLATGHIAPAAALVVLRAGAAMGLARMVATHVSLPITKADLALQKEYLATGAVLEHCFYTPFHGLATMAEIAASVKQAGPAHIILSTDMGQPGCPEPPEALRSFCSSLHKEGISWEDLHAMVSLTPKGLLS